MKALSYKCEAFIKITRLFIEIFREMDALIRNLRLFEDRLFEEFRSF
jgi:hypothetical protein